MTSRVAGDEFLGELGKIMYVGLLYSDEDFVFYILVICLGDIS